MLVAIPDILTAEEVAHCRRVLEGTQWVDGRVTAGEQSAKAKFNLQVPESAPEARQLGELILRALGRSPTFTSAALPFRVFPPLFNRYDAGMKFDAHVDNAVRYVAAAGMRIRTDLSMTLFLTPPEDYDGGELIVQDTYGEHAVKLPAGSMILYPASSLHRVAPIGRGSRWCSFFWAQSMVQDDGERRLLYELDQAIIAVRGTLADDNPAVLTLTNCYHNLLRRWAQL
jgi:PKHD-type hydroxylase